MRLSLTFDRLFDSRCGRHRESQIKLHMHIVSCYCPDWSTMSEVIFVPDIGRFYFLL